jgi:hypothetical protein
MIDDLKTQDAGEESDREILPSRRRGTRTTRKKTPIGGSLRTATCSNLVFLRRFSRQGDTKPGRTKDYVSREDAKIAKSKIDIAVSS